MTSNATNETAPHVRGIAILIASGPYYNQVLLPGWWKHHLASATVGSQQHAGDFPRHSSLVIP